VLCKTLGFHGGDYEESHLLGGDAVWLLLEPTFWGNVSLSSSELKRNSELGTTLGVTSNRSSCEDDILHSHRREHLKSYIALTGWAVYGDVMCFLLGTNWGFISQKTELFIVTAVKTSTLTRE
jgi:hypothetical protein